MQEWNIISNLHKSTWVCAVVSGRLNAGDRTQFTWLTSQLEFFIHDRRQHHFKVCPLVCGVSQACPPTSRCTSLTRAMTNAPPVPVTCATPVSGASPPVPVTCSQFAPLTCVSPLSGVTSVALPRKPLPCKPVCCGKYWAAIRELWGQRWRLHKVRVLTYAPYTYLFSYKWPNDLLIVVVICVSFTRCRPTATDTFSSRSWQNHLKRIYLYLKCF